MKIRNKAGMNNKQSELKVFFHFFWYIGIKVCGSYAKHCRGDMKNIDFIDLILMKKEIIN